MGTVCPPILKRHIQPNGPMLPLTPATPSGTRPGQRTDTALTHWQTREPPGCHISQLCLNQPQETGEVIQPAAHLTVPLPVPPSHKTQPGVPALTASLPSPAPRSWTHHGQCNGACNASAGGGFPLAFYQGKVKSPFLKRGNSSLVFIPADLGHSGKQREAGRSQSSGCSLAPRMEQVCLCSRSAAHQHCSFHLGRKLNVFTWNLRGLAKGL